MGGGGGGGEVGFRERGVARNGNLLVCMLLVEMIGWKITTTRELEIELLFKNSDS